MLIRAKTAYILAVWPGVSTGPPLLPARFINCEFEPPGGILGTCGICLVAAATVVVYCFVTLVLGCFPMDLGGVMVPALI